MASRAKQKKQDEEEAPLAPYTHRNWNAFKPDVPPDETHEWPLFSDAWFTGELRDLGPYSVLNAVAMSPRGHARAALVLRGGLYVDTRGDGNSKDSYHGSAHQDELAALLSLCTGVRLKAGGRTRWFKEGKDPLGAPTGFGGQIDYVVPEQGVRLPRSVRDINNPVRLQEGDFADRLRSFQSLDDKTASVLVTSARLYQDALWLAEGEPNMAWLFLVSAIETVAHHWRRRNRNHVERLNDSRPKLVEMLRAEGGDELVRKVALEIADYTGAGLKFAEFILAFDPGPPSERRLMQLSVDWTKLRDALRLVYQWRSKALHGGTPFPFPMCDAPLIHGESWMGFPQETKGAIAERPLGLAAGTGGAMWDNEETPMLLHVFEHITRGALLRWWEDAARTGGGQTRPTT